MSHYTPLIRPFTLIPFDNRLAVLVLNFALSRIVSLIPLAFSYLCKVLRVITTIKDTNVKVLNNKGIKGNERVLNSRFLDSCSLLALLRLSNDVSDTVREILE